MTNHVSNIVKPYYAQNKNNFHYNYIDLGDIFNENIPDRNYEHAAPNKIAQRTSINKVHSICAAYRSRQGSKFSPIRKG